MIIGGSGQIGRAVARTLLGDGWRVTAIQRHGRLDDHENLEAERIFLDRE